MIEKKRVLICDMNNLFIRSYVVNPTIASNGNPIGALKGVLQTIQKLSREINPNRIVICWDGKGGSSKRKLINKGYKDGRSPLRLNRNVRNLDLNEELENRIWQMTRLTEYFNEMPIIQLMFDGVEADDLISAVAQHRTIKNYHKVIVSSDKDFIQLCDSSTILYRPIQQEILNKKNIVEQFGIHPTNFCLARSICGDKSDNLSGVEGVGLATVAKRFPFLAEEKEYNISDIMKECKTKGPSVKAYQNILDEEEKIKENYKIMQLAVPNISVQDSQSIDFSLDNSECRYNKLNLIKMSIEDGMADADWSDLYMCLKKIQQENC